MKQLSDLTREVFEAALREVIAVISAEQARELQRLVESGEIATPGAISAFISLNSDERPASAS